MFHVKHFYSGHFALNYFFENNTVRHKKDKRLVAENVIANLRFYPARPNPTACGCSWIPIIQTAVGRVVALHGF